MTQPTEELAAFVRAYEAATNSHDVDRVAPLVADNATYWFTDGSYAGVDAIRAAMSVTFDQIKDETYRITDVEWVFVGSEHACFCYQFQWEGTVSGVRRRGQGRGTNVTVSRPDGWQMLHEHLST
ncbi:MAG: YybH family protein [Nocardioidaceae bacterium]